MPPHEPGRSAPADRGATPLASLWRTRVYLRPYRWQLVFMLACAIVAVGAEIAIPLLTKSMIDGAISHGERALLLPIGAAAIGLGVGQALLNFLRRWMQAGAVTGMEQSMRADIYAHLQRLPPAFHDEWQSGQLLSRATTDLSAIRRFAGFGTIFLITNVVTFIAVVALLIRLNWWLGLLTATVFLPVVAASTRFQQTYRVLSRRAQDQQGDLATYVEEAATGIRVLKALGRGDEAAGQHRGQALEVFGTELQKARLRSTFWAGLDLIPNALIGVLLLLGAIATSRHELTLGGLVAFITLTLQLVWPIESMGYILAGGQEAATSAQRVFEILDTQPAITSPAGPRAGTAGRPARPAAAAGAAGLRPRRVQVPGRGAAVTARREPGGRAGPDRGAGRGDGGGQDEPAATRAPPGRRDVGGRPARWHRCAAAAPAGAAVAGRVRVRGPHPVLGQCPGERCLRGSRRR